ncbi:hypothetical protein BBP40_011465 [Aspergillus hancockii]|nr:hypothetical protein BBP40_011465 [Aspergillus hancockii]
MGYNHSVFDGTGAGAILEMLADCCRAGAASETSLTTAGDIESEPRGFLSSASVAVPKDSQAEYVINCAHTEVEADSFPAMLCNYPFLLPSEKIERLRDACNSLLPYLVDTYSRSQKSRVNDDAKWPGFLSSNDVLTALLAIEVERAREAAPSPQPKSTSLAMAVNLRKRLTLVPSHYLGNLVTTVWTPHLQPTKRWDTLLSTSPACEQLEIEMSDLLWVADVAFRVRLGLSSIDEEHACGLIHYLHSQDDWEQIGIHFTDPVFISSWRHLKVYEPDFSPGIGQIQDFGMEVGTSDGAMDALMNDPLFGWARVIDTFE